MTSRAATVLAIGSAAFIGAAATACHAHEPIVIPEGAQVVHVTASDEGVALAPDSVVAGDVYFVIEGPNQSVQIVSRMTATDASSSGMDRAQVERVSRGDFQDTAWDGFEVTCGLDEWTPARHWQGCGENHVLPMSEGLYGVVSGAEEPGVPPVMAVLEVTD